MRTFLGQLAVGEDFQFLKDVYIETVENAAHQDDPGDPRISRPYLLLSLGNATAKNFRIRQTLFNLANKKLLPRVPVSVITSTETSATF